MPDHAHMMLLMPPKYAVSQGVGYIKGKSAIPLARVYGERKRSFVWQSFWVRGYFVSTVSHDEAVIGNYIRHREKEGEKLALALIPQSASSPMCRLGGFAPDRTASKNQSS